MHTTICDFLLDIIQNSLEADASVVIIEANHREMRFEATVADNGCGMDEAQLEAARDPFSTQAGKHDHRRVGLGIPFVMQTAELTGGEFDIQSEKGMGTSVRFVLPLDHVDTPPVGDVPGTFLSALSYPGSFEMIINRRIKYGGEEESYQLVRSQLQEALGEIQSSGSLTMLKTYLASQEEAAEVLLKNEVNREKEAIHGKNDLRRTEGAKRTEKERIK